MPSRSFDSQTRMGIPRPSKAFITEHRNEMLADEGTLILEPAPISLAPPSSPSSRPMTIPPPPPSSMRPMIYSVPPPSSVRPSMPSWDDRSGWSPTHEVTKSTRVPSKTGFSTRDRSASAMLIIATAAMLAALASIGFMHKSSQHADIETTASAAQPVAAPITMPPAPVAPPVASPIASPVVPSAASIDIDDDAKPAPAPMKPAAGHHAHTPAPAVSLPATPAPAEIRAVTPAKPTKETKEKTAAPPSTAQKKALEDLLEQLGEEQLKR